jgi:hypothetical protein
LLIAEGFSADRQRLFTIRLAVSVALLKPFTYERRGA